MRASANIARPTIQAELEEEFVNFELATLKAQNIRNVNEKEIQRYNAEKQIIRADSHAGEPFR